jgi:hypothetical protein
VPFKLFSVELEFVSVELESKLALTFDMVNENSERIKRKLIERKAKKLY